MRPTSLLLLAVPAMREGGTLGNNILADLPTDPASLFVVLLLIGSAAAVVWFGRTPGGPPR